MWHGKSISVVFPAYNEEEGISDGVKSFLNLVDSSGKKVVDEVIVVDNNSRDRTAELAKVAGARVVTETRQGYGAALMRGLKEANADWIALCEPDGTFLARDLFKFLAFSEDFELIIGTRTTRELIWAQANMGWFLRVGNLVVAKLLQALYGTCSLSDCGCTFRLLSRAARDKVQPLLHVEKSHFLPNVVIAARTKRVQMIEIPVNYRGRVGTSKITGSLNGTLKTGFSMICLMLAHWPGFIFRAQK